MLDKRPAGQYNKNRLGNCTINELFIKEQNALGKIFYKTSMTINESYEWELELLKLLGAAVLPFWRG